MLEMGIFIALAIFYSLFLFCETQQSFATYQI